MRRPRPRWQRHNCRERKGRSDIIGDGRSVWPPRTRPNSTLVLHSTYVRRHCSPTANVYRLSCHAALVRRSEITKTSRTVRANLDVRTDTKMYLQYVWKVRTC